VNQCSQDDQNKNSELAEHRPTGSVADSHKAGEQSEMLSDLRQRSRTKASKNPGMNWAEISHGRNLLDSMIRDSEKYIELLEFLKESLK
jgi:hypothetical protein